MTSTNLALNTNTYMLENNSSIVYFFDGAFFFLKEDDKLTKIKTIVKNDKYYINFEDKIFIWKIETLAEDLLIINEIELDNNKKPINKKNREFIVLSAQEYENEINEIIEMEEPKNSTPTSSEPLIIEKIEKESIKESFNKLDSTEKYFFYFSLFFVFLIFLIFLNLPPLLRDISIIIDILISLSLVALFSKKIMMLSTVICKKNKEKIESILYKKEA